MRKSSVIFLVFVVFLFTAPAAFAQEEGFFALGFSNILKALSNKSVAVGFMILFFGLVIYGAIAAGLKASPFGGAGNLDKNGKIVAVAFTGLLLAGTFFLRNNAMKLLESMANIMGWFFALIFSLIIYVAVRWMFKQQGYQSDLAGNKIHDIVAWLAGWSSLLAFGTLLQNKSIMSVAWIFITFGTIGYLFMGHKYSKKPDVQAGRTTETIETAQQGAIQAGEKAQADLQKSEQVGKQADAAQKEVEDELAKARKEAAAVTAPEDRRKAMAALTEAVKAEKKLGELEEEEIKTVEKAIDDMKSMERQLEHRLRGLEQANSAISAEPGNEEQKRHIKTLLDESRLMSQSIGKTVQDIEARFSRLKNTIMNNISKIKTLHENILNREKKLEKATPEEVRTIKRRIREMEVEQDKLINENLESRKALEQLRANIQRYIADIQEHLKKELPQIKKVEEEEVESSFTIIESKQKYEEAIKAGIKSGSALEDLAINDKQGFFAQTKVNYYHEALKKLKDKKITFNLGARGRVFAFIDEFERLEAGTVPLYNIQGGKKSQRFTYKIDEMSDIKFEE
ncbi:hypothetical protein KY312_02615 [Candidatus Woesearchaeota archaeon]|nr:hypothetical protein [Candidatus Woesearchaeota archaeon]